MRRGMQKTALIPLPAPQGSAGWISMSPLFCLGGRRISMIMAVKTTILTSRPHSYYVSCSRSLLPGELHMWKFHGRSGNKIRLAERIFRMSWQLSYRCGIVTLKVVGRQRFTLFYQKRRHWIIVFIEDSERTHRFVEIF